MEKKFECRTDEELLADYPQTPMDPESSRLFDESPLRWINARNAQFKLAAQAGDRDAIDRIIEDISHIVGKTRAMIWAISIIDESV